MKSRGLQNSIAESRMSLPVMSLFVVFLYILISAGIHLWWIKFVMLALSIFLLEYLNTSQSIIRIYSRMASCAFLLLYACLKVMHDDVTSDIVVLTFIGIYNILFRSFQSFSSVRTYYYAFLVLSVCSLFFHEIVLFVPLLWLLGGVFLRSLTVKSFVSSLLGLMTPYWFFILTKVYLRHNIQFEDYFHFYPLFEFSILTTSQIVLLALITLLFIVSSTHFMINSFLDKIKIRMFYYTFIIIGFVAFVFLILQPQHYYALMSIIILNMSFLLGHYIALTRSRLSNIFFIITLLSCVVFIGFNIWIGTLNN